MDWAKLLNDYGFPTALFLLLASHIKGILAFAERMLSKAWPTFAEQRRLKLERLTAANGRLAERQRLELEQAAAVAERTDTIMALKEMLRLVRESLRDEQVERRLDKERLYKIIERHEQLDAQIVEALRDISEVMRNVSRVLGRIAVRVGVYNDADKKTSHD
jgi:hypothetical protein